jgi:hypothetical protein
MPCTGTAGISAGLAGQSGVYSILGPPVSRRGPPFTGVNPLRFSQRLWPPLRLRTVVMFSRATPQLSVSTLIDDDKSGGRVFVEHADQQVGRAFDQLQLLLGLLRLRG